MIESRIERTYRIAEREAIYKGRVVSGLYPEARLDDLYFERIGSCDRAPELEGLQPSGFVPGSKFDVLNFDFDKLAEVRETALRYFRRIDGFDCEADIESVLPLVRELHSCPESVCQGELQAGELILALWMADIPFRRFKYQDLPETIIFAMDWDEISDPANYLDDFHGYENLLRPSAGWMKREHVPGYGVGVEFVSLYPKEQKGSLAGPYPVCVNA
jgi:hypothetical protein